MTPEELLARVRAEFGEGIPPVSYRDDPASSARAAPLAPEKPKTPKKDARGRTAADHARAAKKRAQAGAKFEAQLDDTHEGFTRDGFGHILPHYPPTVQVKDRRILRAGGGPCDYSGHVNLAWRRDGAAQLVSHWERESARGLQRYAQVPVVFDAKVLGAEHASYRHDPARIKQIHHLIAAASGGALAFLLVRADEIERVFIVGLDAHRDQLLRARPIRLFSTTRTAGQERDVLPLLPSVGYTPGKGWLWPALLPYLMP